MKRTINIIASVGLIAAVTSTENQKGFLEPCVNFDKGEFGGCGGSCGQKDDGNFGGLKQSYGGCDDCQPKKVDFSVKEDCGCQEEKKECDCQKWEAPNTKVNWGEHKDQKSKYQGQGWKEDRDVKVNTNIGYDCQDVNVDFGEGHGQGRGYNQGNGRGYGQGQNNNNYNNNYNNNQQAYNQNNKYVQVAESENTDRVNTVKNANVDQESRKAQETLNANRDTVNAHEKNLELANKLNKNRNNNLTNDVCSQNNANNKNNHQKEEFEKLKLINASGKDAECIVGLKTGDKCAHKDLECNHELVDTSEHIVCLKDGGCEKVDKKRYIKKKALKKNLNQKDSHVRRATLLKQCAKDKHHHENSCQSAKKQNVNADINANKNVKIQKSFSDKDFCDYTDKACTSEAAKCSDDKCFENEKNQSEKEFHANTHDDNSCFNFDQNKDVAVTTQTHC